DVMPAENQQLWRALRGHTSVPLAVGEVFTTVWDAQVLIAERLIDYVRAAVTHAGGISHLRKLYAFAETFQVKAAPHGPSDISPIGFAASLHLALATTNFGIHEYMGYDPLAASVFHTSY